MRFFEQHNRERAAAFSRLVRLIFLTMVLCSLAYCAFSQKHLTAAFSIRITGDTTEIQHRLFDIDIDSALVISVRGKNETYVSHVTGAEVRESSLFYILEDGVVHYKEDTNGKIIAWTGPRGKWIFYDYLPIGVKIVTKRD